MAYWYTDTLARALTHWCTTVSNFFYLLTLSRVRASQVRVGVRLRARVRVFPYGVRVLPVRMCPRYACACDNVRVGVRLRARVPEEPCGVRRVAPSGGAYENSDVIVFRQCAPHDERQRPETLVQPWRSEYVGWRPLAERTSRVTPSGEWECVRACVRPCVPVRVSVMFYPVNNNNPSFSAPLSGCLPAQMTKRRSPCAVRC